MFDSVDATSVQPLSPCGPSSPGSPIPGSPTTPLGPFRPFKKDKRYNSQSCTTMFFFSFWWNTDTVSKNHGKNTILNDFKLFNLH